MPITINLLTDLGATGSKYDFATGSQEYPSTIKETFKKIKELLCRKK